MSQPPSVYLADLTHTAQGISALSFPLGTAFVAAYAKQVFGDAINIRLFKYPEELSRAVAEDPPALIGFSCYTWNIELSVRLARWAKARNQDLCVVFGGPNFPTDADEKVAFLGQRPEIDFFIENEGEFGFANLLGRLIDLDFSSEGLKTERKVLPGCTYLAADGELVAGLVERIRNVNVIPSPYLTGLLDPFFDQPLIPMIETTRGCPFSCSFCADGIMIKNKVIRFEPERVRQELEYIAERVHDVNDLIITDLNFGMYADDEQTAQDIADLRRRHGWPRSVGAAAGKNKTDRILKIAAILEDSWTLSSSLQSSDADVLANIKRANIASDAYLAIMSYANRLGRTSRSASEIILALPGDTKEKHFESLRYSVEKGCKTLRMFQAMMLVGTDMASRETRRKFELLTRHRVVTGCAGCYDFAGETVHVAEVEEIIVGGSTMPFDDYVECRKMNLIVDAFYNGGVFEELYAVMREAGISPFEILERVYHATDRIAVIADIINRFNVATVDGLHKSRMDMDDFLAQPGTIDKYQSGELGANELLEHKALLFVEFEAIAELIFWASKQVVADQGFLTEDVALFLDELRLFVVRKKKHCHLPGEESVEDFQFDFPAMDALDFAVDLQNVAREKKVIRLRFFHDESQKTEIRNAMELYRNHPGGFARMLYKNNLRSMSRQVLAA